MLSVDPPATRPEIVAELNRLHEESTRYWRAFPTDAFFRPFGAAWSPADNVRHLTKSIRAVARALSLPRLFALVAFGPAFRPSRPYAEVVETYRAALAAGGRAGRFAPAPRTPPADLEEWREEIMRHREEAARALVRGLERWSERALDRCRLPHPLLGKLTVREMLFFTLYHNLHHVHVVERRKSEAAAGA
jgi:DinB family protein